MNGFITVAIAHDATCEPGDEWMFHGMAESKKDKHITKEEVEDAKIGCVVFCIILLVGIGFGIYYLITH